MIADTIAAVGPRLRALREKRSLTLVAVSERTGISASTLSRLESGLRKPTLELLLALASVYSVSMDDLVETAATDPRIVAKPFTAHGRTYFPLSRRPGGVQAFRTVVHAGPGPEPVVPRTHEGYEWLYVLSGRLRVVVGDTDLVLQPGEVVELDTRVPHFFGRAAAESVEFLSLFGKQGERMHVRHRT